MTPPVRGRPTVASVIETGTLGLALFVGSVGLVGLTAALLGRYSWRWALVGGAVVAGVGVVGLSRSGVLDRDDAAGRRAGAGAIAALVLVVAWTAVVGWSPSQHVVGDRDPASYLTTAVWLADGQPLDPDVAVGGFQALRADEVTFASSATFATGPRTVEFQFNHLTSVLLAVADGVGGTRLLLRVPALAAGLGLLVLYFVAVRCTRRPLLALVAPALLAAGLPWWYVGRDTYSEPVAVLLLWSAVMVLVAVHDRPDPIGGAVGGFLLGATVAVRVDALMYVAGAVVLAAVSVIASSTRDLGVRRLRSFATALGVTVLGVAIAQVDLWWFTGRYARDLRAEILLLVLAVAVATVCAVVAVVAWWRRPTWRERIRPAGSRLATAAGLAVVALFAGRWFVRPLLGEAVRSVPDATTEVIAGLQAATGQTVEPLRTYAESTGWWMAWYLGIPGFAAAVIGAGLAARRTLRVTAPAMVVVVVLGLVGLGSLYLWRPSITPDQLWASRRYVPAVLPALALLSTLPLGWILERPHPSSTRWRVGVVVAISVAMLVVPARSTWRLRDLGQQRQYLDVVLEACDLIGDDATVLVVDPWAAQVLPSSLRSWCRVPVGVAGREFDDSSLERLVDAAAAEGRRVVFVSVDAAGLAAMPTATGELRSTRVVVDRTTPDRTLASLPDQYADPSTLVPDTSPDGFQLHVRPVLP